MKIVRRLATSDNHDIVIEFVLSDDELERAYREQEHRYRLADAKDALDQLYESEQISSEVYRNAKQKIACREAALWEFEKTYSCNVPENEIWESAWKKVIKDMERRAATNDKRRNDNSAV